MLSVFHVQELLAQAVQFLGGCKLGANGGGLFDGPERVEGAPLDPRVRPGFLAGFFKATAPIRHHHVWWGDPVHERFPGARVLTACHIPAQDEIPGLSNQDDRFAAQVDRVNEHDLMHLIHHRGEGPDLPQTLASPAKRPAPTWHIRLPITAEQPGKKLTQVLGRGINPLHAS